MLGTERTLVEPTGRYRLRMTRHISRTRSHRTKREVRYLDCRALESPRFDGSIRSSQVALEVRYGSRNHCPRQAGHDGSCAGFHTLGPSTEGCSGSSDT